jgi:16S rRNA (adenine1518-N6/adenine1519-N6)-dimethyltransferase
VTDSVPALLRAHGLRPRKRLGQNFLTDPVALSRIVAAAELTADDAVVEVGSGLGTLTRRLAEQARLVVAIELDDDLVEILLEQTEDLSNVRIIHGDVLQIPDPGFAHRGYKVVANLPYYITSAVLRHFLGKPPRPILMVVTVQREVALRMIAEPGQMSLLAVSVQLYGQPRVVARIPPGAFYPPPQVDSAVVRIDVGEQPAIAFPEGAYAGGQAGAEAFFFQVVKAGFGQKRKMLRNALSAGLRLPASTVEEALMRAGVDPRRRAETLSLQEWAEVAGAL